MKHKNNSISHRILFEGALIALLLLGISFISQSQIISTFAGDGYKFSSTSGGYSGDGGPATAAELSDPNSVVVTASGNVYIADYANARIREVNTSGIISTFAGIGKSGYSGDGGPATAAEFTLPTDVVADASGNFYIADFDNNRVRMVNASGIISTFAGNGTGSFSGDGGLATAAELDQPIGIAIDPSGNVYIADLSDNHVRMVNTSGIISTFAGNGGVGFSGNGGPATAAELDDPDALAIDASGKVYIVDDHSDVRVVSTSGTINLFAGNEAAGYYGDGGPATAAEFTNPAGIAIDSSGNVYIGDQGNNRIRIINTSGIIATVAGNGIRGHSGDGGPAVAAELGGPPGVAVDASGNIYTADYNTQYVRKISPSFSVLASGVNISGCTGGTGSVSAVPFGGTGPYSYLWTPGGQTTSTVTEVNAGTYTVTLTENGGTTATTSVSINALTVSTTLTSPSCSTGNNGKASATPSNGTSPYTYSWSGGLGTKSTASALGIGTYSVTVTDKCGASTSASVTVTQASTLATISASTPNCIGLNNGTLTVTASDGVTPYIYSWSPSGGTKSTATGLSAGTYTVTVRDNCSTSATVSVTITQASVIASISGTTNISCNGQNNGSATITASDGKSPYTYSWSGDGGTSSVASGLSAGTYTITVQDNCGGSATASVNITQPGALTVNAFQSPACLGNPLSAMANSSKGTVPYTYSWSGGGGTNSTASELSAGTYTITVMDACGGTATSSVNVIQPVTLTTGATKLSNACNGISNGNAEATPSGGTSPYTYSWSNGSNSNPTGTTLSAGTYTVTVMDNCGGSATASVTIKQSTAIIPTAVIADNVSCNGGSNGMAKASAKGGTSPYAYFWGPNNSSTYIASGLSAGTYTVTVVDNNGCNASSSTTITQPTLLKDSVSTVTYPQCGGETASATIGVTGGTSPYKYTWSPNISTTATATGLTIRGYAVQVKDANGCYNNIDFSITQPPVPVLRDSIVKSATVNVSCNGGSNGSATVGVKYGTSPYTYSWSPNVSFSATATGLSMGMYTVTVNDADGCTVTASVSIGQPGTLSSVIAFVGNSISCHGGSNGLAKVSVSGGSSPYTYSWSPVSSSTYIASGLSAGTYSITVEDNCGTSASSSIAVTQPAILSDSIITSSVVSPPCSGGGTGSATIGVTGGTSPYNYKWSPNVSTTATATGLTVRSYIVQVKDANGCYNNVTVNVACSTPETVTYKGTGANCCPLSNNINLYPNPNTGQFTLSGLSQRDPSGQQGMVVEMYDYTGKMISRMTTTNESIQLNILNQADGIYLIRILDKDGNLVSEKKVVKTQ